MVESSVGYQRAIVGDARRILLKAVIDIIDPDITYSNAIGDSMSNYAKPSQLIDKVFDSEDNFATLELNRWVLDGTFEPVGESDKQVGWVGDTLSGADGTFSPPVYVEQPFSNVSILQACSIYFSENSYDGIPVDFTVEVKQGETAYYTKEFTGNTKTSVSMSGFTVYDPDAIRVTAKKWSLPYRRMRTVEIVPGLYEEWNGGMVAAFNVRHQANFSCLALPYGTCTLKIDNLDRRFEPRGKNGMFQSIEDRQGIDVSIGVRLEDESEEYKRVGIFYQYSGGWRTGDNGLSIQWDLVDIVGLLADREFIPPDTLPVTLSGWFEALVAQLGSNFVERYHVDPDYANLPATVANVEAVTGKKCGEIMRWVCMATGTWPRADAETGELTAEPLWNQGNKINLDNLNDYPTTKSNDDLAAIIFTLADGNNTRYVVSGNSISSSNTISVNNPFIQNEEQALTAARLILSTYGGNKLEVTGRGDPASEIGDVDTIWMNDSTATTGRRISQTFSFSGGIMQGCQSTLLQADGSFLYQSRSVITESGTWTAPAGVATLRVILVGHGEDGTDGTDGTWDAAGLDGADGLGGKVWAGTISVNDQQTFDVEIGDNVIFGPYSSANGKVYPYGYADIASGDSFARTGVPSPLFGSGDGGAGGKGGVKGNRHTKTIRGADADGNPTTTWKTVIDNYPGDGTDGVKGVSGCVVVYWDKEEI